MKRPSYFNERDKREHASSVEAAVASIRERRERADLKAVCQTPEGRRLVARMLEESGLFAQSFDGTSQTFFNEGRRALGVAIFRDLESVDPAGALFVQCRRDAQMAREGDRIAAEKGSPT